MSLFWRNSPHWLHRNWSKWQLPVNQWLNIQSKWQPFQCLIWNEYIIPCTQMVSNFLDKFIKAWDILASRNVSLYRGGGGIPFAAIGADGYCRFMRPADRLSVVKYVSALTLWGFHISVGWCTVPWSRSLFKMAFLCNFCTFLGTLNLFAFHLCRLAVVLWTSCLSNVSLSLERTGF